jgi:tetratricopeptide (TPR) repeat protein
MHRLLILVAVGTALAVAQNRPADLGATMQVIAQSLGVACNYCHSAERGSGAREPKKDIARQMMAMTADLSMRVQQATGNPAAKVECITCHHGVPIPRQLTDIITDTLREKGATEAVLQYRALRDRFYGKQAFDFSEDTLIGLASRLAARNPDDAIALARLNLDYNPKSSRSYSTIAYAYTRKLDNEAAMTNYLKAAELDPSDVVVQGQIESLKSALRRR